MRARPALLPTSQPDDEYRTFPPPAHGAISRSAVSVVGLGQSLTSAPLRGHRSSSRSAVSMHWDCVRECKRYLSADERAKDRKRS
jgi:hypothetical protein